MCPAICSLTAFTAAGDEQLEESPNKYVASENSHLNWVERTRCIFLDIKVNKKEPLNEMTRQV
jgi:hypothetical protein